MHQIDCVSPEATVQTSTGVRISIYPLDEAHVFLTWMRTLELPPLFPSAHKQFLSFISTQALSASRPVSLLAPPLDVLLVALRLMPSPIHCSKDPPTLPKMRHIDGPPPNPPTWSCASAKDCPVSRQDGFVSSLRHTCARRFHTRESTRLGHRSNTAACITLHTV